jgi:hypothetical protein
MRVRIHAQGVEIAKWLRVHTTPHVIRLGPITPGLYVVSMNASIVVEYGDFVATSQYPTLDHETYVELDVCHPLIEYSDDHAFLAASALIRADEALGGALGRCSNLQVSVES